MSDVKTKTLPFEEFHSLMRDAGSFESLKTILTHYEIADRPFKLSMDHVGGFIASFGSEVMIYNERSNQRHFLSAWGADKYQARRNLGRHLLEACTSDMYGHPSYVSLEYFDREEKSWRRTRLDCGQRPGDAKAVPA
jgi:hypothetical protein